MGPASQEGGIAADLVAEARRAHAELHERVEEGVARHKERMRSTTKTRKSAETRRRIMETASQLITERGNTAFQMSEISRRCGMSKGALYYYFADKEDLVRAIFDATADDLVAGIDAVVQDAPTAEDALLGICNEFAQRTADGSPLAMALVRELVQSREGTIPRDRVHIYHIIDVVTELLESAKAAGNVRSDLDCHLASVSVCGAFTFGALSVSSGSEPGDDLGARLLDFAVLGIGTRRE